MVLKGLKKTTVEIERVVLRMYYKKDRSLKLRYSEGYE